MDSWLRPKTGGTAHLTMRRTGSHVEFWCGRERDDEDLRLPGPNTKRCRHCEEYKANSKKYPPQGTRTKQPGPEVEIGLDYTRVHFSDGISVDLYGGVDPRLLAKRAKLIAAAPELLELAEYIDVEVPHGFSCPRYHVSSAECQCVRAKAAALLAHINGE